MNVFSSDTRTMKLWGPTAAVTVRVDALGDIVGDSWLLSNVRIGAREIVDVRQCFGDVSYIYALGNDQARCTISLSFVVFIGRCGKDEKSNTANIAKGFEEYAKNRIAEYTAPRAVTIGDFSRMGWLVGIDVGGIDASKGICEGVAHFVMEL